MIPTLRINHWQQVALVGSCFSEEMGGKLQANGFNALVNPGGTIFHPSALARLLNWALCEQFIPLRIHQRQDIFLSWDLAGSIYAMSEADFKTKSVELYEQLREQLQTCSHLFVTFGTAIQYRLKSDGIVVANCHKAPQASFDQTLTTVEEMVGEWQVLIQQLKFWNPDVQIVFTVSPVRHLRDGLVENNRSKARLLLLAEALSKQPSCSYFEAYELVVDQLRDYAYFKADGAHPNQPAIDQVWELFQQRFMDPDTLSVLDQWAKLQQLKAHRILYPESLEAQKLQMDIQERERAFKSKYPQFIIPTL